MKKLLLALGLVAAVALARPAPASAHVSFAIGLPGFGVFVNAPPPPPVVYAPPAYYPPPYGYYAAPPVYVRGGYGWGWGHHHGWHGRRWR